MKDYTITSKRANSKIEYKDFVRGNSIGYAINLFKLTGKKSEIIKVELIK